MARRGQQRGGIDEAAEQGVEADEAKRIGASQLNSNVRQTSRSKDELSGMKACRLAVIVGAVAIGACNGEDAMRGQVFVPIIPRSELVGTWKPKPVPPPLLYTLLRGDPGPKILELRSDESCQVSQGLAQSFIECEMFADATGPQANAPCVWRVEGKSEQNLSVIFRAPDQRWLEVDLGLFRHMATRQLALIGTCGLGDAWALFRAAPPSA